MTENFSSELINECAKDLCFYSDKCECKCFERNCETSWEAEKLLRAGWIKLPVYIGKPVWLANAILLKRLPLALLKVRFLCFSRRLTNLGSLE